MNILVLSLRQRMILMHRDVRSRDMVSVSRPKCEISCLGLEGLGLGLVTNGLVSRGLSRPFSIFKNLPWNDFFPHFGSFILPR